MSSLQVWFQRREEFEFIIELLLYFTTLCWKSFIGTNWILSSVESQKGVIADQRCSHWEPEGRYCHRLCTAIAPFWFSAEHRWSAITPFWLSTDVVLFIQLLFKCRVTLLRSEFNLEWRKLALHSTYSIVEIMLPCPEDRQHLMSETSSLSVSRSQKRVRKCMMYLNVNPNSCL